MGRSVLQAKPAPSTGKPAAFSQLSAILGPSLMMSGLSILNTLFSFAYQLMVAQRFGARAEMDAYLAAMTLPAWIIAVLMTPLDFAFVPAFVERISTGKQQEAWRIANTILKLLLIGFAIFSVFAFVWAYELMRAIAPGLPSKTCETAVWVFRILVPGVVFQAAFSMLTSLHYSVRSFALPSIAPIVYVFVNVAILFAAAPSMGIGSVALGTTVGQAVQALLLLPILLRSKSELLFFRPGHQGVMEIMRLMAPLVAVGLFFHSSSLVERFFASSLPESSISYLGYATKLLLPLNTILATGIVVSIFPHMSEQAAGRGKEALAQVRHTLSQTIMLVMFIMLPVAAWLAVLRVPMVTLLLERGAFDHSATLGVAAAIPYYLGFWILFAVGNVLTRALLAVKDTVSQAGVELAGIAIFVFFCALLAGSMGYVGLALSRSLYYFAMVALLLIAVQHRLGGMPWPQMLGSLARITVATLLSAGVTSAIWTLIGGEGTHPLLQLLLPGTAGAMTYLGANWLLGTAELMAMYRLLLARFSPR